MLDPLDIVTGSNAAKPGADALIGAIPVGTVRLLERAAPATTEGRPKLPGFSESAAILEVVTNPTGNWALENLPAFEELYGAIEQLSLEAGAAGDSVSATGSLETAAPAVDLARERVARAAAVVRRGPLPPDAESARHLAAMLDALDEFRTTGDFTEWVQSWTKALEHRDEFTDAFTIANGQKPPAA